MSQYTAHISILIFFSFVLCCKSFTGIRQHQSNDVRFSKQPQWITDDDGVYSDKGDVSEVLAEIMKTLSSKTASYGSEQDTSTNDLDVEGKFNKILSTIRGNDNLSVESKSKVIAEITMALEEVKQQSQDSPRNQERNDLETSIPQSTTYSVKDAPYCIIYGPGPVGQNVLNYFKTLGKAAHYKTIDGEQLSVINESELKYICKDVRTVIIATDTAPPEKKGWFGAEDVPDVLNAKALKRLLNTLMKARDGNSDANNIKVLCLGKAMKKSRGAASFLMGDDTDFESDLILQCQQRSLPYLVVKVGDIVADDVNINNVSTSPPNDPPPVTIKMTSQSSSGSTRVSHASEALLRAVSHPTAGNTTIVVMSTGKGQPTDAQWDDEFLKTSGPELMRIPLKYASVSQAAIKLGRIASTFQDMQRGVEGKVLGLSSSYQNIHTQPLVTPIEVIRFGNGVKVVFRPKESAYTSSKEEKLKSEREAAEAKARANLGSKSGYVSPELEATLSQTQSSSSSSSLSPANSVAKKQKKQPLEGGLEVVVESTPIPRVRIRRCEMGPQTIVKEESESILLKAFTKGLEALENDYKQLLTKAEQTLK
eukprot:gene212-381_t